MPNPSLPPATQEGHESRGLCASAVCTRILLTHHDNPKSLAIFPGWRVEVAGGRGHLTQERSSLCSCTEPSRPAAQLASPAAATIDRAEARLVCQP